MPFIVRNDLIAELVKAQTRANKNRRDEYPIAVQPDLESAPTCSRRLPLFASSSSFAFRIIVTRSGQIKNDERVIFEDRRTVITSVFRNEPRQVSRKGLVVRLVKFASQIFVKDEAIDSMRANILAVFKVDKVAEAESSIKRRQLTAGKRWGLRDESDDHALAMNTLIQGIRIVMPRVNPRRLDNP